MKMPRSSLVAVRPSPRSGLSLIQCLVYIAVIGVLISVGGFTVAKAWDAHRAVTRNANDIHRAMNAGERWRQEVRRAIRPLEVMTGSSNTVCRITTAPGIIEYQLTGGSLQRRDGDQGAWLNVLSRVRASDMRGLTQAGVTACRWELEMEPAHKRAKLRPLFTFTAVPRQNPPNADVRFEPVIRSSRREEAQTLAGRFQMEPPYVGCYEVQREVAR
jgi:hypothetical protein